MADSSSGHARLGSVTPLPQHEVPVANMTRPEGPQEADDPDTSSLSELESLAEDDDRNGDDGDFAADEDTVPRMSTRSQNGHSGNGTSATKTFCATAPTARTFRKTFEQCAQSEKNKRERAFLILVNLLGEDHKRWPNYNLHPTRMAFKENNRRTFRDDDPLHPKDWGSKYLEAYQKLVESGKPACEFRLRREVKRRLGQGKNTDKKFITIQDIDNVQCDRDTQEVTSPLEGSSKVGTERPTQSARGDGEVFAGQAPAHEDPEEDEGSGRRSTRSGKTSTRNLSHQDTAQQALRLTEYFQNTSVEQDIGQAPDSSLDMQDTCPPADSPMDQEGGQGPNSSLEDVRKQAQTNPAPDDSMIANGIDHDSQVSPAGVDQHHGEDEGSGNVAEHVRPHQEIQTAPSDHENQLGESEASLAGAADREDRDPAPDPDDYAGEDETSGAGAEDHEANQASQAASFDRSGDLEESEAPPTDRAGRFKWLSQQYSLLADSEAEAQEHLTEAQESEKRFKQQDSEANQLQDQLEKLKEQAERLQQEMNQKQLEAMEVQEEAKKTQDKAKNNRRRAGEYLEKYEEASSNVETIHKRIRRAEHW